MTSFVQNLVADATPKQPVRPPWYAFIMPWEVPAWHKRGAWKRRHRRIAALEYKLGIADESHGLRADENLGYCWCGEVIGGW